MLINDKIAFDRHYCINSAKTKEIMVHFILHSRHIFICIKSFILIRDVNRSPNVRTSDPVPKFGSKF